MSGIGAWVRSDDCEHVDGSANGRGRGDGYDVDIYRSRSTGRYLIAVAQVHGSRWWYTAETLEGARAVGAAGYTPGHGPGRFRRALAPGRLAEVRALREVETSPGALADQCDLDGWDWCSDAEHGPKDRLAVVEAWGSWWLVSRGSEPDDATEYTSERRARDRLEDIAAFLV